MSLKWNRPAGSLLATLILVHGAGAPMDSPFMERIIELFTAQGIAVARFEFPYMAQCREDGRKRLPNPQVQLLDCWRRVHAQIRETLDGPLALGGKSMGGHVASLLVDELGVNALVCLGHPFYAAGKPEKPRVVRPTRLRTPTPIVQGERDVLGNCEVVAGYALAPMIRLHWLTAVGHDLKPLRASGLAHKQHLAATTQEVAGFLHGLQGHQRFLKASSHKLRRSHPRIETWATGLSEGGRHEHACRR